MKCKIEWTFWLCKLKPYFCLLVWLLMLMLLLLLLLLMLLSFILPEFFLFFFIYFMFLFCYFFLSVLCVLFCVFFLFPTFEIKSNSKHKLRENNTILVFFVLCCCWMQYFLGGKWKRKLCNAFQHLCILIQWSSQKKTSPIVWLLV